MNIGWATGGPPMMSALHHVSHTPPTSPWSHDGHGGPDVYPHEAQHAYTQRPEVRCRRCSPRMAPWRRRADDAQRHHRIAIAHAHMRKYEQLKNLVHAETARSAVSSMVVAEVALTNTGMATGLRSACELPSE